MPDLLTTRPQPCRAPTAAALPAAIRQWQAVLGAEHVLFDSETIERYGTSTLPRSHRPLAVLRPGCSGNVQHIVRVAGKFKQPLYPISRGKNWGYGDASPTTAGQVIVDLGRMNRILEVNDELAYAVIEPGVTQGQLATHLQEIGSRLMLDVTGAGPDASIVGNTLERGFGHTPYGDHLAHMSGLELVLADGEILHTGFGAYPNAQAANVFPWGIGPWLDGLFTQSNFGIVTRMGIQLMPASPVVEAFALRIHDERQLGEVVERLRELRLAEVVRSTVHIANDLRVLSARDRYRSEIARAAMPLPSEHRLQLRRRAKLGAWNLFGGLYAPRELRRGTRAVVRKALREFGRVLFFDRVKLNVLRRVSSVLPGLQETLENADSAFQLLEGVPTGSHLRGIAWRSELPKGCSVDPTSYGLMWLSPVLPANADACREVVEMIENATAEFQFEPLMTLSAVTPRALCCVSNISYDKSSPQQRERAAACYDALLDRLLQRGYLPYRIGVQSMQKLTSSSGSLWPTVQKLKHALDPHNIIAPERYSPAVEEQAETCV